MAVAPSIQPTLAESVASIPADKVLETLAPPLGDRRTRA
jgi:hypothetical protein